MCKMEYIENFINKLFVKKQYVTNSKISLEVPTINISKDIDYFATFFILFLSILIIIFITSMSWYVAHNKADKERRCYSNNINSKDRKIDITAYDRKTGYALYNVKYDLDRKKFNTNCVCEEGNNSNNFKFNAMNLSSGKPSVITKSCLCNSKFDSNDLYYKGTPGLIDFMNNKDNTYVFSNPSIV